MAALPNMNKSKSSRIRGSLLGGICADAMLAVFEGGILERGLWKLIGKTFQGRHRYTDDTAMNLDIMDEYLENGEIDQDRLARRFAGSYRWSRGYGPDAGRILKGIRRGVGWRDLNRKKFSDGSFGGDRQKPEQMDSGYIESCRSFALTAYLSHGHQSGCLLSFSDSMVIDRFHGLLGEENVIKTKTGQRRQNDCRGVHDAPGNHSRATGGGDGGQPANRQ